MDWTIENLFIEGARVISLSITSRRGKNTGNSICMRLRISAFIENKGFLDFIAGN
jgi:hypothetical protein